MWELGDRVATYLAAKKLYPSSINSATSSRQVIVSDSDLVAGWDQLDAADVSNTPSGSVGSVTVQAAINELAGDIASLSAGAAVPSFATILKFGVSA